MNRFIIYKTDHGRYSVRPIDWEGIWDKYGRIQENGLNHIAIFSDKEDAEFFVKAKEADEQGKMLILPCKPGDTVYICKSVVSFGEIGDKSRVNYRIDKTKFDYWMIPYIGKTVFLTESEAEKVKGALEEVE